MPVLAVSLDDVISKSTVSAWDVGLAVAALVLAWISGRYARRGAMRLASQLGGVNDDLQQLAGRIAKYTCWLLGAGIALTFLGAEIQPLLAAVLIVGVIAVLAIRGVTDNFAAGIVIQTRRPIHIGDEIDVLEQTGIVREMNSRAVVIETFDGRMIHLPNSKVLDEPLANHTLVGARRAEVEVRVERPGPAAELLEALRAAVTAADGVVVDRPVFATLVGTDPQQVRVIVRYWHRPMASYATTTAVVGALTAVLADRSLAAAVTSPVPPLMAAPPPTL
jgi:small-conductance mechanosensitive channel